MPLRTKSSFAQATTCCLASVWLGANGIKGAEGDGRLEILVEEGGDRPSLELAGARDRFLYIIEKSDDLEDWSERNRIDGETIVGVVDLPLGSVEDGFVRLRRIEKPPEPAGLSAVVGDFADRVALHWEDSGPPDGYAIYRSRSEAFSEAMLIGMSLTNQYEDRPADRGVPYFYWIGSRNSDAEALSASPVQYTIPLALPASENFIEVPAGVFLMGSPSEESGRDSDETQHEVSLTRGFFLGKTEVAWTDWTEVREWALLNGYDDLAIGKNGREGDESGTHPATEISWSNAVKWCNARSEKEGRTPVYYTSADFSAETVLRIGAESPVADWEADGYRLPTEAEWEFACRAETATAFYTGGITHPELSPLDENLDLAGWYGGNSDAATHPVGGKQANAWGLFDMHGNLREWCWDWYGPYESDAIDPKGPESGEIRVFRGGSWGESAKACRSANRDGFSPTPATDNYGFRVALRADR